MIWMEIKSTLSSADGKKYQIYNDLVILMVLFPTA